jgi:hypothetical protein
MKDSLKAPCVAANDVDGEPLPIDGDIAALLGFAAVPRKVKRPDGWTAERQREFVHRLALCGSPSRAADQMGKNVSGIEAIYRQKGGETLRAAWDAAIALWTRRAAEAEDGEAYEGRAPGLNVRAGSARPSAGGQGGAGQVLNEYGEWEDEESLQRRAEDARDSISNKLRNARRLYLRDISDCPAKRAAFEILTELPIDWDKAEALEAQDDEPWRKPRMRQADMLLTAEAGWLGDVAHGRNRMAERRKELRREMDAYHAKNGLPPIEWGEEWGE